MFCKSQKGVCSERAKFASSLKNMAPAIFSTKLFLFLRPCCKKPSHCTSNKKWRWNKKRRTWGQMLSLIWQKTFSFFFISYFFWNETVSNSNFRQLWHNSRTHVILGTKNLPGREFDSRLVLAFSFLSISQLCVLNQVPQVGETPLIFLKNVCLAAQLVVKQA